MKKTILVLAMAVMAGSAYAGTYRCTVTPRSFSDFGDHFNAVVTSRALKLVGVKDMRISGKIDRNYHPRAKNAGSVRYHMSIEGAGTGSGCDEANIVLNRSMANGGDGLLTILFDCDSDGSGPMFETFACQK
jgi:hypothetical protein